jgi:hypothetical protein
MKIKFTNTCKSRKPDWQIDESFWENTQEKALGINKIAK